MSDNKFSLGSLFGSKEDKEDKGMVAGVVAAVGSSVGKSLLANVKNGVRTAFSRFKQGGFSCLGKQAFNERDLEHQYNDLSNRVEAIKDNDPYSVAHFLNFCSQAIVQCDMAIAVYRSKCSKQNREAYKKTLQNMVNNYAKEGFTKSTQTAHDHNGTPYQYTHYTPNMEYFNPPVIERPILETPEVTMPVDMVSLLGENIVDGEGNLLPIDPALYTPGFVAPIGGENKIPELEIVKSNGTPTWSVGGSGKTADGVDWHLGAGKSTEDNTIKLALLGLLGLVAYKVLIKK